MSRIERVTNRFPRFYRNWEKESVISILLQSMSEELDEAEGGITDLMKSHWIDTAKREDLDKMATIVGTMRMRNEDDEHLRTDLKKAVDEYRGGGTLPVILKKFTEMSGNEKEVEIIENPLAEASAEFAVTANETWTLGSNSIQDEQPNISLTVEGEGKVSNPQIMNLDTGQSITFKGKLKTGEQLILKQNAALLDERDVTEKVTPRELPRLLRKGSTWKYSEALLERIGVFDAGKFDEHTFALDVPTVRVRFEWARRQPATFMIQIKPNSLLDSSLTQPQLEKTASDLKAAGINAMIKVTE